MEIVPTLINAAMIAAVGVFLTYITRTQHKDVKAELGEFKDEMRDFRREIRTELREQAASIRAENRAEFASVRSDLTQVALAVGAHPRPQTG